MSNRFSSGTRVIFMWAKLPAITQPVVVSLCLRFFFPSLFMSSLAPFPSVVQAILLTEGQTSGKTRAALPSPTTGSPWSWPGRPATRRPAGPRSSSSWGLRHRRCCRRCPGPGGTSSRWWASSSCTRAPRLVDAAVQSFSFAYLFFLTSPTALFLTGNLDLVLVIFFWTECFLL